MSLPNENPLHPAPGTTPGRRFSLGLLARAVISAAFLVWILGKLDWADFGRTLLHADLTYLSLSLAVAPVLVLTSAVKWKVLLAARGHRQSLGACFALYLVGMLFNNVLPSNVGGDVARSYLMGRRIGDMPQAIASVFVERFLGVTALMMSLPLSIALAPRDLWSQAVRGSLLAVVGLYLLLAWVVLDRRFQRFVARRESSKIFRKIARLQGAIDAYRGHAGALLVALAVSLVFYLLAAWNIQVSARAFGATMTYRDALVVSPVVLTIAMLPISLGGVGLAEWAYLFAMGKVGVSPSAALATGLIMRAKGLLLSALGAVAYLAENKTTPTVNDATAATPS